MIFAGRSKEIYRCIIKPKRRNLIPNFLSEFSTVHQADYALRHVPNMCIFLLITSAKWNKRQMLFETLRSNQI